MEENYKRVRVISEINIKLKAELQSYPYLVWLL